MSELGVDAPRVIDPGAAAHAGVRPSAARVTLRRPCPEDGLAVHRLIGEVGKLEQNTGYAYVLLCDHFAETAVVAELEGELVGFVAAYRPPTHNDALFVWQVGVHPKVRGRGLGSRMLEWLVRRPSARNVRFLEATVEASNGASRALFESFARRFSAPHIWSSGYPAALFGAGHEAEPLVRIGPFDLSSASLS